MRGDRGRSPDELRERYLGDIAPLLAAARKVESLSDAQKGQIRRRVLRTAFGSGPRRSRFRLTPLAIAAGLLVAGGMAFAAAERLGLIFRADPDPPSLRPEGRESDRRKSLRSKRGPQDRPSDDGQTAALAPATEQEPIVPREPPPAATPALAQPEVPRVPARDTEKMGRASGSPTARVEQAAAEWQYAPTAKAGPRAWSPTHRRPALQTAGGERSTKAFSGRERIGEQVAAAPTKLALATPYLTDTRASVATTTPSTQANAAAAMPQVPAASEAPAESPVTVPSAKAGASDPVLFGQALRKLRAQNDAAAALTVLQQHAQAYPHSPLAGERAALEVEALLSLHRDREALQKLDSMSLDNLPRSGERFVVRGELRAATQRWMEARDDFDRALSAVTGAPAWHERALWGRGVARLRCGDRELGMKDIERYHDLYPNGRFAAEAARFFRGK